LTEHGAILTRRICVGVTGVHIGGK
jgi:hypothetical protein